MVLTSLLSSTSCIYRHFCNLYIWAQETLKHTFPVQSLLRLFYALYTYNLCQKIKTFSVKGNKIFWNLMTTLCSVCGWYSFAKVKRWIVKNLLLSNEASQWKREYYVLCCQMNWRCPPQYFIKNIDLLKTTADLTAEYHIIFSIWYEH